MKSDLAPGIKPAYDAELRRVLGRGGVDVSMPQKWAPAVVLLMHEVGEDEMAVQVANEVATTLHGQSFRDLTLAGGIARRERAYKLAQANKVAEACENLAEAARALRHLKPQRGPFKRLLGEAESALETLQAPLVIEHIWLPPTESNRIIREEAVRLLREMMIRSEKEPPEEAEISLDYFYEAIQGLTAQEMATLTDWELVARGKRGLSRWQPALRIALHSMLAAGFAYRSVELLRRAKRLLLAGRNLLDTIPIAGEKVACYILLGEVDEAENALLQVRSLRV